METTIETVASEASAWFERRKRDDGEQFVTLKDGAPEWVRDMVYDAHGVFGPDDWRYRCIEYAVYHIAETGDEDSGEFADSFVDVYTMTRFAWLASNLNRMSYVDDAVSEFGYDADQGIVGMVGLGQYMEASEVYGLVWGALDARAAESC